MIRLSITPRQAEILLSLLEFSIEEMEFQMEDQTQMSVLESRMIQSDLVSVKTLKSQIQKKTDKI